MSSTAYQTTPVCGNGIFINVFRPNVKPSHPPNQRAEDDFSSGSNAKFNNVWSYTSNSQYTLMTCCLTEQRGKPCTYLCLRSEYEILSSIDCNSFDLDDVGGLPYLRANLAKKYRGAVKSVSLCHFQLVEIC